MKLLGPVLKPEIQKLELLLDRVCVVEHAHDRAGSYKFPVEGTMHIVLQTGKGALDIAVPRGCVKLDNGYYAILELFEKNGKIEGKVLTCLSEYQLATSRNMHFGDHFKTGFAFKANKVVEVENEFYGKEWASFLRTHPAAKGEMHINATEVKFSDASTLKFAGFTIEGRLDGNNAKYYKLQTMKVIVACK